MLADSMDATSNARFSRSAGITSHGATWIKPTANKAYTDGNLKYTSPGLKVKEEDERELLSIGSGARFEQSRFLLSERMVDSAADKISELIQASFSYRHLEYTFHEKTGEYFVKVIDDRTDEVIREIPPRKMLDIFASLKEIAGLLFDERR